MAAVGGRVDQPVLAVDVDEPVAAPQVAVQACRRFVGGAELAEATGDALESGDRGTVRMQLEDVKRFDSGVVLLTYLPA